MPVRTTKKRMLADVEPIYCGVDEAEILSGVSRWTWRAYAYKGLVESCKVGSRLLIPVSEIKRVLAEGTRRRLDGRGAGEPSAPKPKRAAIVRKQKDGEESHA